VSFFFFFLFFFFLFFFFTSFASSRLLHRPDDSLVGNACEHFTSVWMACKGKMELTIGVSVGSSIQISAGMIPLLVIIAWPMNRDLTLFFSNFETIWYVSCWPSSLQSFRLRLTRQRSFGRR